MSFRDIQFDWLEEIILPAIDRFYKNKQDRDLIQRNASERTIVANIYCKANSIFRQKQRLNPELEDLGIDLEYNRNFLDSKKAYEKCNLCHVEDCFITHERLQTSEIYPDFLIHQRGFNVNNQVAIEFKKTNNNERRIEDKKKLIYLTCQQPFPQHEVENYQYRIGFFIDLDTNRYSVTTYQDASFGDPRYRQGGVWL